MPNPPSPPGRPDRHGGLVVLLTVCAVVGLLGLAGGLAVAVSTRLDTPARVPATLASVGTFAWVPLLAAVLLLGLVAALARGPWARATWGAVVVGVAALVVQAVWLAPRFTAEAAPPGGASLVVMTANLEYGAGDARAVVRQVRERGVDLLALEEVTPDELTRLRAAGLQSVLPASAGSPDDDASGTMVFSRLPLSRAAALPVSRGGVAVTVGSGQPFRFLAVHLSDPLFHPGPWYADLTRLGATAARSGGPVLVAGDFNTVPDHAPFRRLLGRTGLRDAAEQAGSGLVPTWPGDRAVPVLTIDHVLTDGGAVATRTERVHIPGTDHLALVAHVRTAAAP